MGQPPKGDMLTISSRNVKVKVETIKLPKSAECYGNLKNLMHLNRICPMDFKKTIRRRSSRKRSETAKGALDFYMGFATFPTIGGARANTKAASETTPQLQ